MAQTVFASGVLSDRLMPSSKDTLQQIEYKVSEIMKYINTLAHASEMLRRQIGSSDLSVDKSLLRIALISARKYTSLLLMAVNKGREYSERMEGNLDVASEENDQILDSIQATAMHFKEFISRMSKMPQYMDRPNVERTVRMALDSGLDKKSPGEIIDPARVQYLMLELNQRAAAGDDFSTLISDLDKHRVKATRGVVTKPMGQPDSPMANPADVAEEFQSLEEKYEQDRSAEQYKDISNKQK
jgi:hypothetical protein